MKHPKITLAITHFERFEMLVECIAKVRDDPRIQNVVVLDDHSLDGSWEQIKEMECPGLMPWSNLKNFDCYRNKREAVSFTQTEWLILFDSDNVIDGTYLDTIFNLPEWNPKTVYCPDFARPHFDYRKFSGMTFSRSNVARYMKDDNFKCCLNTCNYFVNREQYLNIWDEEADPHTSDSIYQMYNWFERGNEMNIVTGLQYFHRVHEGSHYKLNHHKTGDFEHAVESSLKNLK